VSKMKQRHQERHPVIPGLVRLRTPQGDLWPYLPREVPPPQRKQQQTASKLLSDDTRKSCSPLGGQAVSEEKEKR
jgi:hypothetical protein